MALGANMAPTETHIKLGRLTKRSEFLYVRGGKYAARQLVVVQMRENPADTDGIRAGFTATKKVGNAVVRNRAKRRLRECVRAHLPGLGRAGHDYVFIARAGTAKAEWDMLSRDVEKALLRLQ